MSYVLYQWALSDEQIAKVNAGEMPVFYQEYFKMIMGDVGAVQRNWGQYQPVAEIDAPGLEEAFQIGNIGPEQAIKRLGRMRSVSVGDVLIGQDGGAHAVATFGFKPVELMEG